MKIVIAGAGDVGFHLARLLANEQKDITLIDTNKDVLDYAKTHLDVFTILGDSASTSVLKEAEVYDARLFLAVTTSQKNNLVSAILAKKMGAKQTVARVRSHEYLAEEQRAIFQELGVDKVIAPSILAANEIRRLVKQAHVTDYFDFENGKMSLAGITLDEHSPIVNLSVSEVMQAHRQTKVNPIHILRGQECIIPKAETVFRDKDHAYFLADRDDMGAVIDFTGKEEVKMKNIMIIGGTEIALNTALLLENKYNVTIVESNEDRCNRLLTKVKKTLVVHANPNNMDMLKEEGLMHMDVFIALTQNSETNIISSVMAKELGVFKTIAMVSNVEYTSISMNIGIDTIINAKLIAANNIFRFIRKGRIEAITSMHGVEGEIIEFVVQKENQLTRKPLNELPLPEKSLVGGVIRGDESIIPDGGFIMQPADRVIVYAHNDDIDTIERLFK